MAVPVARDIRLNERHPAIVTQKVAPFDLCRVDALVAEFAEETSVALVGSDVNTAKVAEEVASGAAIDMVNGEAGGNSTTGSHPDSMRDKDVFMITESIPEY